jgi:biotin transporter BioY
MSFILGAYVTGKLTENAAAGGGFLWNFVSVIAGMATIYSGGVVQLWLWTRASLTVVLFIGVVPFLPGDLVKGIVAAFIASRQHLKDALRKNLKFETSAKAS